MYFDKFPILRYLDRFGTKTRTKLVTDILRRVQINTVGKDESSFYIDYDTRDGDTPENISHRLYDTPDYFWVVLLINEALNPYYDIALDSISLDNYSKRKHYGKYLYLTSEGNTLDVLGITFSPDETIYSTTGLVDDFGVTQENYAVRARVVSDEPSLNRIRVDGGEHEYFVTGSLIGAIRGSDAIRAKVQFAEDVYTGLHHFETGTGDRLDPLAALDGTPLGLTGVTGSYTVNSPSFWETRLGVYLGISGSRNLNNVITNYENDINENDAKRTIKLIHPDQISKVVDEFDRLIKV